MEQEELLAQMGDLGRFQFRLLAVLTVAIVQNGFQALMVVVTLTVPQHRCRLPSLDNDTYAIQSEWHRDLVDSAIPSSLSPEGHVTYDQCRMYVNSSNVMDDGGANVTELERQTRECDSWVYDHSEFTSTVISYFDLVCDRKDFRAHINMAYILGLLIGSPIAGYLCDRLGRKRCLMIALLLNAVVAVMSVIPFHPIAVIIYRMLRGAIGMTVYMALYVLILEVSRPARRNTMGAVVAMVWVLGPLLLGGLSYLLTHWKHLQIVSAAPNLFIILLCWRFIPESPRWLLLKGRVGEAVKVVREAAHMNGQAEAPLPEDVQIVDLPGDSEVPTPAHSVRQLVRYPRLVVRTLIVFFNWCTVSMTYYGLTLNVSNLGGSVRQNFLLSTIVEVGGYSLAWVLLDRVGRKRTHCFVMLLSGLACLATIFPGLYMTTGSQWVTTVLAMVGKLGISAAFVDIYLLSAELFPTVIRNFAIGCSSTAGRVGSITSPYIADLTLYVEGQFGRVLPLIIFGGLSVTAGLLSLLLPETLGRQLPDSVEEAANFGKKTRSATAEGTEMTERHHGGKQVRPLLEKGDQPR